MEFALSQVLSIVEELAFVEVEELLEPAVFGGVEKLKAKDFVGVEERLVVELFSEVVEFAVSPMLSVVENLSAFLEVERLLEPVELLVKFLVIVPLAQLLVAVMSALVLL